MGLHVGTLNGNILVYVTKGNILDFPFYTGWIYFSIFLKTNHHIYISLIGVYTKHYIHVIFANVILMLAHNLILHHSPQSITYIIGPQCPTDLIL